MEALRPAAQEQVGLAIVRREMGIMAVSCGVILFLGPPRRRHQRRLLAAVSSAE